MAEAHIEHGNVPAIYTSMLEVQKGIAKIPKNGEMKFGATNYKFLRAEDVQEKINPLLSENNIIVNAQYDVRETVRANRDYIYVDLELTYISTIDGSKFPPVRATGEAIAADDKAINKSLTGAIKAAHRATFQFSTGDVTDADGADERKGASPVQRKLDAARAPKPAAKKVAEVAGKSLSDAKAKIKSEWIDKGVVTSEQVNAVVKEVQATGVSGAAVFDAVLARLAEGDFE